MPRVPYSLLQIVRPVGPQTICLSPPPFPSRLPLTRFIQFVSHYRYYPFAPPLFLSLSLSLSLSLLLFYIFISNHLPIKDQSPLFQFPLDSPENQQNFISLNSRILIREEFRVMSRRRSRSFSQSCFSGENPILLSL
jgi:hypothetical protein